MEPFAVMTYDMMVIFDSASVIQQTRRTITERISFCSRQNKSMEIN